MMLGIIIAIVFCGVKVAGMEETSTETSAIAQFITKHRGLELSDYALTTLEYQEPEQLLYAADGREQWFPISEVEAQCTVGWYKTKREADTVKAKWQITDADAKDLANVMHSEANGLSTREVAMVAWCVLNRVDDGQGSIHSICNSNQFTRRGNKTQYYWLAVDVLERWYLEKEGYDDVGRVLPKGYFWFTGDGRHNYFRNSFYGKKELTSLYYLENPYK